MPDELESKHEPRKSPKCFEDFSLSVHEVNIVFCENVWVSTRLFLTG